jgi:energy-coupling factor transport system permease protein
LRVFLILESVILLLLTTRPDLLMGDLERRGLPPRLAYVLLASLNLVPTMLRRAGEILEAQTSRGMPLGQGLSGRARALLPMSGPLLLGAVSEVEERALALEARGFGAENRRTWWSDPPRTAWDPALQLLLVLIILMLGGRLFL